jgi:hypothetical protein
MTLWRRIRGVLGTAATWFVSWATLGAIYLLIDMVRNYWSVPEIRDHLFIGLAAMGIFWGVWGAVSGILYGVSVAISQRGRAFAQLRARNLALWGAVSGAAYPGFAWISSVLTPGGTAPADTPLAIALGAVAGAASAGGTLWLARRGEALAISAASEPELQAGLEDAAPANRAYDAVHR